MACVTFVLTTVCAGRYIRLFAEAMCTLASLTKHILLEYKGMRQEEQCYTSQWRKQRLSTCVLMRSQLQQVVQHQQFASAFHTAEPPTNLYMELFMQLEST